jgi:hypothetical protein
MKDANRVLEMTEAWTTDQTWRSFMRRLDRGECFLHRKCFNFKSPIVATILGYICFPLGLLYAFGYCYTRLRIDAWRAGRPAPDGA